MKIRSMVIAIAMIVSAPALAQQQTSCKVSMQQYNRLKAGMSYQEVVKILGCHGIELSSSEMAGYVTVMLMWSGTTLGGNMNAMFQNNEMIQKSQFGLQ